MINIAIKLATSITYTADGSQTNFSVPFDYLRPSFDHVAVNDAEVSEGFTISNRMVMFDSAPSKDVVVRIYRSTPTTRLVSWADASILKAIDMTIAEVQQLHILEEASDWSKTNSIVLDKEGNTWQGRNCRMSNIADPTEAQDVVTKHYLDNEEGSFTATMNALKTKTEEAASTAETNAKQAQTGATNAKTSETNAKTSEINVNASKEAAQSAANSASNFATDARSSASEAKSYRDAASTYATNAKNYSENVNVFIPSVSSDGILSWTNKAGLPNPPSVNIKGKDGVDGGGSGSITIDEALSSTSTNPVQNKVIYNALLDKVGMNDIFNGFALRSPTASIMWRLGSQTLGSLTASNYTGTALRATQDGAGNIITDTYTKKVDFDKTISELEVAFQQKADKSDLADVATSGKYTDLLNRPDYVVQSVNNIKPDSNGNVSISVEGSGGSDITVDAELSDASTNPVQNKVIKAALDNRAVLDDVNTFTAPNHFNDIYMEDGISSLKWYNGSPNFVVASITSKKYTGEAATAKKATQDGDGNIITTTYATKTELNSCVKSVNNTKPDASGNVSITVGSDITVDTTLSSTSTNAIANKAVYDALSDKLGKTETATNAKLAEQAFKDGNGNVIASTYIKSVNNVTPDVNGNVTIDVSGGSGGSSITVDTTLSSSSTNAIANKAVYNALLGKAGTDIFSGFSLMGAGATINWRQGSQPIGSISATNYTGTANAATYDDAGNKISTTYVKSVNNTKPDASGNVTITVGGGVSTSEANDWSAQQYFYMAKFQLEKYDTSYTSGTTMNPTAVTSIYNATGNLTLDLTNLTSLLSAGESIVFTAYITSAADYALTITNGGTLKYIGSPSDLAITSAGLLLNIFVTLDNSGNKTSIVQASKLS